MRFVYTRHALERMSMWRNISREMVEDTVTNPDRADSGRDETIIATKTINREKVKVVYTARAGTAVIITVMTR